MTRLLFPAALALTCALAGLLACASPPAATLGQPPRLLDTPAEPGSGEPYLAVAGDGSVYLTWFEPRGEGHALRIARLDGETWGPAHTIAEGDSFFVNWADYPKVVPLGGERLAAHYPWMNGTGTYSYDVIMKFSDDGGETWGPRIRPHLDDTPTEHGFVTMRAEEGGVRAIWLDARKFAGIEAEHGHGPGADMTIRTAVVHDDGRVEDSELLDERACDCCQTDAVATSAGLLVSYRDRSDTEVRDISLVRREDGAWTAPYSLHQDGWEIPGCPVNGGALSSVGDRVVGAWFTAAGDTARVLAAFSSDGGRTFGSPVRVDGGDPAGRVDVEMLDDGSALVCWMESGESGATLQVRRVLDDGSLREATVLAQTSAARASGFPQMVRDASRVLFAWTDAGDPSQVRLAVAELR